MMLLRGQGQGWWHMSCGDIAHAASVIGCLRTAPAARPQHPMTLAACNTITRHVPPALALAP